MNFRILFSISVLTVALALGAIPTVAQQQSGVDWAHSGSRTITSLDLTELTFTLTTIPATGTRWHCVATCSVEARLISGVDVDGRLALVHEAAEVVGTTGMVGNLAAGTHRLSCRAAKVESADPPFNISDSSITVSCSANHL
jgi:hypothetical protein